MNFSTSILGGKPLWGHDFSNFLIPKKCPLYGRFTGVEKNFIRQFQVCGHIELEVCEFDNRLREYFCQKICEIIGLRVGRIHRRIRTLTSRLSLVWQQTFLSIGPLSHDFERHIRHHILYIGLWR